MRYLNERMEADGVGRRTEATAGLAFDTAEDTHRFPVHLLADARACAARARAGVARLVASAALEADGAAADADGRGVRWSGIACGRLLAEALVTRVAHCEAAADVACRADRVSACTSGKLMRSLLSL